MRVNIIERKVISLGGSTIYNSEGKVNVAYFVEMINFILAHPEKYLLVMGGGSLARNVIEGAIQLRVDTEGQDSLGIHATRLNAHLLDLSLESAGISTYYSRGIFDEHYSSLDKFDVITTGGTIPGHTTDRVAVQCAARYGDKHLVNVTNVGGVYEDDPRKNSSSNIIKEVKGSELIEKWGLKHIPGMNFPIEPRAVQEALEKSVYIHVIGENMEDLERALFDRKGYNGTLVMPE